MDTTQTKGTESQKDATPSRTLFIMIATSLFHLLSLFQMCSLAFIYGFNMFCFSNSLVNPIIYSYSIVMSKKMF